MVQSQSYRLACIKCISNCSKVSDILKIISSLVNFGKKISFQRDIKKEMSLSIRYFLTCVLKLDTPTLKLAYDLK